MLVRSVRDPAADKESDKDKYVGGVGCTLNLAGVRRDVGSVVADAPQLSVVLHPQERRAMAGIFRRFPTRRRAESRQKHSQNVRAQDKLLALFRKHEGKERRAGQTS